jgi:hypothetical protein
MLFADWVTISALATAAGTLVLALATFASVRSANRAARVAELSLLEGLRPLLVPTRLGDPAEKIGFADGKWLAAPGGGGAAETRDEAIYLGIALRNVGSGIAVLHGWYFHPELIPRSERPAIEDFTMLTRDLYIAPGDQGFWQGAFRDPTAPAFASTKEAIDARQPVMVDVLYGDYEGGQRVVSRYSLTPRDNGAWTASAGRHWNIDREDPRRSV